MAIFSAQSCCDLSLFDIINVSGGTGFNAQVHTIEKQLDGKILVGGTFTQYNGVTRNRIIRLNTDGSIDNTFNIGSGFNQVVYAIAVQSDGKIVVGGDFTSYDGNSRNRIIRLNSDGTVDGTFNIGTGFNAQVSRKCIIIQSDGKIVVGGIFTTYNGGSSNRIVRLNSDGTVDGTFNIGTGFDDDVASLVLQSDGKIVIGGSFATYNGAPAGTYNRIIRLNSDGTADGTFSIGTGFNTSPVNALSIQSDGKIITGGFFTSYNGNASNYIARLNTDGTFDNTFNIGTGFNTTVSTLGIQSDGKIIVGGFFTSFDGNSSNYIARLNTNGSYDNTFNIGTGFDSLTTSILIQNDDKVLVGGLFITSYDGNLRNRMVRLNSNGTLDGGFNGGGSVGEFYFSNESGFYGCWELLALDAGPSSFSATTGPYSSCTECRQTSNNECCFEITNCDTTDTYYSVLTAGTLNVGEFYYFDFVGDSIPGCYEINSLSYSASNFTMNFIDGPFVDCPDCKSGASTSNFYYFSSCCTNTPFLLTDIPTTLSFGEVYYIESDLFSGCAEVISATPVSNIYSAISLTLETDCESCISSYPCKCEESDFCFNTSYSAYTGFNGTYSASCCYNSNTIYTNSGGTAFVFYDGIKWCLSTSLGGSCILHGNSPCQSLCPDLCEDYFFQGSCPTTTTTTSPCNVFDFDGIFDCLITSPPSPTPSPTPTIPPTSTPLPTPTPTVCNLNFTYSATSIPDPTPTITPTPTPTPSPDLPVGGSVQFSLFDETFKCPVTKKLFDCIDNRYYYVNEPLVFEGQDIMTGETFGGFINGKQSCLTFDGISTISSNAILENIFAVYGFGCNTCQPFITTTLPPGCEGVLYNLIQKPYNFVTNGNILFAETSNPGATEGLLNPNTFDINSVNFSVFDSLGNSQISYFSAITGNNFTITFSQGSNSSVYTGTSDAFFFIFDTIYFNPSVSTGSLTLIQSSDTIFNLSEPVCVSFETIPPQCDCSFYQIGWDSLSETTWSWLNCNTNNSETITLSGKDFNRRLCAKTNSVTSEVLLPTLISDCCNLNCLSYSAYNTSVFSERIISYVDCDRNFIEVSIPIDSSITFCAIESSVTIEDGDVIITNLGPCTL